MVQKKAKPKRKKTVLRIVKETYSGEMTIEEAFEPYFVKNSNNTKSK